MEFKQEEILEKYNELSQGMKDIVSSDEVMQDLREIGRESGLRIDKVDALIEEAGFVMLGLRKTSDFIPALAKKVGMKESELNGLAESIDNKVFSKVRLFTGGVAPSQREDALTSQVNSYSRSVSGNPAANDPYKENLFDDEDSSNVDVVKDKLERIMVEETQTEDFKDHFAPREEKNEDVVEKINNDPYKESIDE